MILTPAEVIQIKNMGVGLGLAVDHSRVIGPEDFVKSHETLRAQVAVLEQALEKMNNWFESLKTNQDELFGHGLQQACDNWDKFPEATQSIDLSFIKEALESARKLGET